MAKHEQRLRWWSWKGSMLDVVAAVKAAHEVLRRDFEGDPHFYGKCHLRHGQTISLERVEDLDAPLERPAKQVRAVYVALGPVHGAPRIVLDFDRRYPGLPAVEVEVTGDSESAMLGYAAEMKRRLDGGRRLLPNLQGWMPLAVSLLGVLVVGAIDRVTAVSSEIALATVASPPVAIAIWWLVPHLELVEPGGRTRWQRFWGVLVLLIGSLSGLIAIWDKYA